MTAVPSEHGAGVALICDSCGWTIGRLNISLDEWSIVWQLATKTGWSGSDSPTGPHFCQSCTSAQLGPESP